MLFFGCVGLINLVSGLPLVALALVPGARIFSAAGRAAALDPRLLAAAAAKGLLDNVLSDYLWARAVLLIGRDAALIRQALEGTGVRLINAASMDDAVQQAAALAQPGDAVLMSPACASFDMFQDYAHRAAVFAQAVQSLALAQGQMLEAAL